MAVGMVLKFQPPFASQGQGYDMGTCKLYERLKQKYRHPLLPLLQAASQIG